MSRAETATTAARHRRTWLWASLLALAALLVLLVGLAALSTTFTTMADDSTVLPPEDKAHVAQTLERDAELMSNTELQGLLVDQPQAVQEEVVRINTEARPLALQVALAVPILAALLGLANSFRMVRLPDPESTGDTEGLALG